MKPIMLWLWVVTAVLLSGCSSAGYYAQSVKGQMEIWRLSRPIASVLDDPSVPKNVKTKLELALDIRRFAVAELGLPDNESYTEFVDLKRTYVVWSVFAAPELSLQPVEWCFLVVGCVTYRGYFEQPAAQAFARKLEEQGYEVYIGGVPAYSTLGWFDDPVPNTILDYREEDLAGLIFHELAHQVAFAKDDTEFNESFATAVERFGVEKWLQASGDDARISHYRTREQRNEDVIGLILEYRAGLQKLYASAATDEEKRLRKQALIKALKQSYDRAIGRWPGYRGYKYWFEQPINNAKLISVATYNELVPALQRLLAKHDGDLDAFYEAARQLAKASKAARREILASLNPTPEG